MDGLIRLTAGRLAALMRDGEVSSTEVVEAFIARIESVDPLLNAVVAPRFDEARREAREADRTRAAGAALPALHGLPFTAKEAIAFGGLPWTNGSRATATRIADRDAGAIRNVRAAGGIFLGGTNVPEFCAFYDTDNDVYGRTCNPHDLERSPGGSSGGESAALAACMTPLGVGSDLGSSIRQPACWTGVFGLKPSRDLVPIDGHAGFGLPPAWRLFAVIGPMARSADDLELGLAALAGHALAPAAPGPLRVAVFEEDGLQPVAAVCRDAVRRAAAALASGGHEVVDAAPPAQAEVRRAYDTMLVTEPAVAGVATAADPALLSRYGRMAVGGLDRFRPDLAPTSPAASACPRSRPTRRRGSASTRSPSAP